MTKTRRVPRFFICLMCTGLAAFSLAFPEIAGETAFSSLILCAKSIVPSLFLFMVSAKMFIKAGGAGILSRATAGVLEKAFGLSPGGVTAMLLGLISGYPMGAVTANELYLSGELDRREAEDILPFITAASPAFLIGAVGSSMFGSSVYGASLLLSQIFSSLLLIFLTRGRRKSAVHMSLAEKTETPLLSSVTLSIRETG
ncbi:MAG: hypothetical protein ACI4QR_03115, partial [Eubacteriales bacterium]